MIRISRDVHRSYKSRFQKSMFPWGSLLLLALFVCMSTIAGDFINWASNYMYQRSASWLSLIQNEHLRDTFVSEALKMYGVRFIFVVLLFLVNMRRIQQYTKAVISKYKRNTENSESLKQSVIRAAEDHERPLSVRILEEVSSAANLGKAARLIESDASLNSDNASGFCHSLHEYLTAGIPFELKKLYSVCVMKVNLSKREVILVGGFNPAGRPWEPITFSLKGKNKAKKSSGLLPYFLTQNSRNESYNINDDVWDRYFMQNPSGTSHEYESIFMQTVKGRYNSGQNRLVICIDCTEATGFEEVDYFRAKMNFVSVILEGVEKRAD